MAKTDLRKTLGESVRVRRRQLALSQAELGERAGLHRTYVCDVEHGSRNVSLACIAKLAGALDVPVSALFP